MIKEKNIVLTGGTSGIGKEILNMLAAESSNTIIVAARSAAKLTEYGENVIPFPCDMSTKEGVDALFEKIEETFDLADIFIGNAGAPYYELYNYTDWDRIDAIFRLNAISPMYIYAKYMEHLNGRQGRLAYTISAMGEMAMPGYALYTSTKFALKGFQQAIRLEHPKNLKLTCIYPVATKTNFFKVGGGAVEAEQPFPVQDASVVAKATIKGIEKGKQHVYPFALFPALREMMTLIHPVRTIYWNSEKKRLDRHLQKLNAAQESNQA